MAITTDYLSDLSYSNKVVQMYQELNVELTANIIKKLKETGDISSYTKSQLKQLMRRGGKEVFLEALEKTSNLSTKRKQDLKDLYTEIAKEDMQNYKKIYDYRGKELEISVTQYKILNNAIKNTNKEIKNFTRSVAFSSQQDFIKAVDDMYFQVSTGGTDFNTAFRKATDDLVSKGTTLTMKNGNTRSIEASVRQNVLTGVRDAVRLINRDIGKTLGCDGVQINISPNCRPEHIPINGKIFKTNSFEWKSYKDLLNDYNCQHFETPIITDIEGNMYTESEIAEANSKVVVYQGNTLQYYEATQIQRGLERNVRNAKREYLTIKKNGGDLTKARQKITKAQSKVKKFVDATGLERDYIRERYAGYN